FTFGLQYAQGDEKGTSATTGRTLAAEAGSDATIEFGQIDYTIAGLHDLVAGGMATKGTDAAGRTTYTIPYNAVETSNGGDGVLPNRQVIGYTVTVTDNGDGTMDASAAIDDDAQTLAFTNYPSSVTATVDISGTKVLTGTRPLKAGDFSFTISGVDEDGNAAPLPEQPTVENSASGAVNFGTITFELDATEESVDKGGETEAAESSDQANADDALGARADENGAAATGEGGTAAASADGSAGEDGAVGGTADESASSSGTADEDATLSSAVDAGDTTLSRGASKTYTYTITESGTVPGVTNDTPKTFKVTVTCGDDGFLTVETSPDSAPLFTFSNTYQPTPGSSSVTSQIDVDKVLDGRDLTAGEFTFTLAPTQVPEGAARPETVSGTNAADGTVTMPSVTFDRPGTYTFELTEDAGDAAYVTYDSVTYDVTARVTDACDGNPMSVEWIYGGGSSIIFENTYTPPTGPVPDPASGPGGSIIPSTGDGTVVPFAVFATLGVGLVVLGAVRRRRA
ncbi:MAG: Spy0128 family protein, partial [Coriobacteriales bacterium]